MSRQAAGKLRASNIEGLAQLNRASPIHLPLVLSKVRYWTRVGFTLACTAVEGSRSLREFLVGAVFYRGMAPQKRKPGRSGPRSRVGFSVRGCGLKGKWMVSVCSLLNTPNCELHHRPKTGTARTELKRSKPQPRLLPLVGGPGVPPSSGAAFFARRGFFARGAMAYTAILQRIRLLIPEELDGHYNAIRRGFEEGDLTTPSLAISNMVLARAISEFTGYPPNEASIATLERRLNPQY
jgi:hypothetical protein